MKQTEAIRMIEESKKTKEAMIIELLHICQKSLGLSIMATFDYDEIISLILSNIEELTE